MRATISYKNCKKYKRSTLCLAGSYRDTQADGDCCAQLYSHGQE